MKKLLHAQGHLTINQDSARAIGLNFGAAEFGLIMATDDDGARHTLVAEPEYLSMIVEASHTGPLQLAAEQSMIALIRPGWASDWDEPDDAAAWKVWAP